MSGLRRLAELFEPISQETPFGGRSTGWEPVGVVWLSPGRPRLRSRTEAGAAPRALESRTAEARVDPRLRPGRMLRFDGGDWRILAVAPHTPTPGRAALTLEREP